MNTYSQSTDFIPSSEGIQLYCEKYILQKQKAATIILHGFAEHCGRYGKLREFLLQNGYSVFTFDFRGHGKSEGLRGYISSYYDYIEDFQAVLDHICDKDLGCPIFAIGHSQGGLILLRACLQSIADLRGIIVSSPAIRFKVRVPFFKEMMGRAMSRIWPKLSMDAGIDPRWLSHDEEVVQAYQQDPLVLTRARARWFTESLEAQDDLMFRAHEILLPALILQSSDDLLVDPQATQEFYKKLGSKNKSLRWYDGFYHECFNEFDKEKVFIDVVSWLDQQTGKKKSSIGDHTDS